jgi:hypothetical protein
MSDNNKDVIPAKAGLRRQDAEANIRVANGQKGAPQGRRVIHVDLALVRKIKLASRFRGNDDILFIGQT